MTTLIQGPYISFFPIAFIATTITVLLFLAMHAMIDQQFTHG